MSKLKLSDVEWGEFFIGGEEGLFGVSGTTTTHPTALKLDGKTPRITCAATNNAVDNFYDNIPTEQGGVLTVDSATIGYVSYQENDFIATDHVEKIFFKNGKKISKNIGLFLKSVIEKSCENKYGYGYKFSQSRIKKQIIMLPIDTQGQPNWQFMENYIKQEQKVQAQKVIDYYERKLFELAGDVVGLDKVEWKTFQFTEVFQEIQRGKRLTKANQTDGLKPYISSTAENNGVDGFIGNDVGVREFENVLTLANSGSVGSTFYQQFEFVASDHVTALKSENADKYAYLFLSSVVKRLEEKYSFNREINDTRIKREKIILPADKNGNPDFQYMSDFVKKLELDKVQEVLEYIYIYISN
nr:restriction endonuclease subunit S [Streptococcus gallolyticus]